MKITKSQLKQIINEEIESVIEEDMASYSACSEECRGNEKCIDNCMKEKKVTSEAVYGAERKQRKPWGPDPYTGKRRSHTDQPLRWGDNTSLAPELSPEEREAETAAKAKEQEEWDYGPSQKDWDLELGRIGRAAQRADDDPSWGGYWKFDKGSVYINFEDTMRKKGRKREQQASRELRDTGESLYPGARWTGRIQVEEDGWPVPPEDANPMPIDVYNELTDNQKKMLIFKLPPEAEEEFEGREAGAAPEGEYDLSAFNESMIKRIMKEELKRFLKNK